MLSLDLFRSRRNFLKIFVVKAFEKILFVQTDYVERTVKNKLCLR